MARRTFPLMGAIIGCLFCCAPSADATLVIVAIDAEVTSISDGTPTGFLENRINVGDMITGVYIYDLSTPDSDLDPLGRRGLYEHDAPPCGITLTVGGFVFMTDPENVDFTVVVKNDYSTIITSNDDVFELESERNLPADIGVPLNYISLTLYDSSGTAISSDALPSAAPVLDDWEGREIIIRSSWDRANGYGFTIRGRPTSAVLIPEPATVCLLALGALGLLRRRKGQK